MKVLIARRPLACAATDVIIRNTQILPQFSKLAHEALIVINGDNHDRGDLIEVMDTSKVIHKRNVAIETIAEYPTYRIVQINGHRWTIQREGRFVVSGITPKQIAHVMRSWLRDSGGYSTMFANCQHGQQVGASFATTQRAKLPIASIVRSMSVPIIFGIPLHLSQDDARFINYLVRANQVINCASHQLLAQSSRILRARLGRISQISGDFAQQLHARISPISTHTLADRLQTDYVDCHNRAVAHNNNPLRETDASVSYGSDGWKIGFQITYNVGGNYGGRRGGGGFSCAIL